MPHSLNPVSTDEDDHRPRHIYYTHETPKLEPELADALFNASRNILIANSWPELIDHLQYNPQSVCVNAKNFEGLTSFSEILSMIKTFAKITNNGDGMTVTLGVNRDTPYKIIKEAQALGIQGMVPDNTCFGWRETVRGLEAQFAGMTYWPKHIIDQLPDPKQKPVQIYFRSPKIEDVTRTDPSVVETYNKIMPVDFVAINNWSELKLEDKPHQIAIHADVFQMPDLASMGDTINMLQTQLKIANLNIPIAIVVGRTTPRSVVMQAKRLGMMGLIPYHGDWSLDDILPALMSLTNRVSHWPKHILDQLPGSKKPKQSNTIGIKLTHRQQQIFDIVISRGCSNKHIARLLDLSESTVKLHMGAIFKKYGVKNRTQLAVFSKGSS